ncbi:MAG TPA: glycoside hydrolase family 38 C-terminal domain-containing protein, partial [Candidatus Obscuribacterales bacterium]
IRNLQLGVRQALSWGQKQLYGYLPDMFGHPAQMPQLLAKSKLAPALIWRGAAPASAWFSWQALDGSKLPAVHLTKGYYMDALHQDEPAWDSLKDTLDAIAAATPAGLPLLLPVGADHMGLPRDLEQRLAQARERFPEYELKLASLPEYLQALKAAGPPAETLIGELRKASAPYAYVLPGVWSTRRYLKQANDRVQTLLEREIEPLLAFQWLGGGQPASPLLWQAWKYLLQNQPHDSICGCSIDEVHQDMLPRYRWAEEIAADLRAQAYCSWGGQRLGNDPGDCLNLLNPGPAPFKGLVETWLSFPAEPAVSAFALLDETGTSLPYAVLEREDEEVFVAEPEILPHWEAVQRVKCLLPIELPALGSRTLKIRTGQTPPDLETLSRGQEIQAIENAGIKVLLHPDTGRILIYRKEDQTWIGCLEGHFFVAEGDAGDSYNYSPPEQDRPQEVNVTHSRVDRHALYQTLYLSCQAFVPARLQDDRLSRSRVNVPLRIHTSLTLYRDEDRVHVRTRIYNQAQDLRLRLLWVTPFRRVKCWSATAFGSIERELQPVLPMDVEKGQERPADAFPYSEWLHVTAPDNQGWALHSEGLHEAALVEWEGNAALSLTLLRCVGWLSRDDLRTRGGGAGPRMPTPEAQCQGEHDYAYSLHLCGNQREDALRSLNQVRHPIQVVQGQKPTVDRLFAISPPAVHLSALTLSACGQAIVIRLVNEGSDPMPLDLQPLFTCRKVTHTDPLERGETVLTGSSLHRVLGPGELITFKFYPAPAEEEADSSSKEIPK